MFPGGDVLLGGEDGGAEGAAVREREGRRRLRPARPGGASLPSEVLLEAVEDLLRAVEGRAAAGLGLGDEDEPLAHVVEGHERAVEGEGGHHPPGRAVVVGKPLEEPGRVPGEVADGSAGEARQAGDLRGVGGEPRPQRREKAVLLLTRARGVVHDDPAVPHLEPRDGVAAEERVPGEPLAAEDALEQEGPLGARGERQEGRHRRPQVARQLAKDRHRPPALGQPLVLVVAQGLHASALPLVIPRSSPGTAEETARALVIPRSAIRVGRRGTRSRDCGSLGIDELLGMTILTCSSASAARP